MQNIDSHSFIYIKEFQWIGYNSVRGGQKWTHGTYGTKGSSFSSVLRLSDGYALIPTFSRGASCTLVSFLRSMAYYERTALI